MAHIEEIRSLASPLKMYQFRVTIANPPGNGASPELMTFRCTAADMPGETIEVVESALGGHTIRDPGKKRFDGVWNTTFIEGTDVQILRRVFSWGNICYDTQTGIQGDRSETHRTGLIELLDNKRETVMTRRIIGIWPSDIQSLSFDEASSEAQRPQIGWTYDYAVSEFE